MRTDGFEILKRAWVYVGQNRYLWPLGFFMALAGGGSQGFGLWVQSPILSGLTGYSPVHRIGERITGYARGNTAFWIVFIAVGAAIGLAMVALGAFAQASAVGAVAEVELGREGDLRTSMGWGRYSFRRYFLLVITYLLTLAVFSVPFYIFSWALGGGGRGVVLPLLSWMILGAAFLVVSVLAVIMLELAGRYLILEDKGIADSLVMAWVLFKEYWRDALVTWLYVMLIALAGTLVMALVLAILSTPLVWIFNAAYNHHNAFLIAASMLAFLLAWAMAAAVAGLFAITGSAVWTVAFLELEPRVVTG